MANNVEHRLYVASEAESLVSCTCGQWKLEITEPQAREQVEREYEKHLRAAGIIENRWKRLLRIGWQAMVEHAIALPALPRRFAIAEFSDEASLCFVIAEFASKEEATGYVEHSESPNSNIYMVDLDNLADVSIAAMKFDRWLVADPSCLSI